MGRFEESLARAREAVRIHPLGPPEQFVLGWALFRARRYDPAVQQLTWAFEQWPDYPWNGAFLAASQLLSGWPSQAVETCRSVLARPQVPASSAYIAATLGRAGAIEEARSVLAELEHLDRTAYIDPYALAVAYAGVGDADATFRALDRVVKEGSAQSWCLGIDVFLDPLRSDPRFGPLVAALGLPKVSMP